MTAVSCSVPPTEIVVLAFSVTAVTGITTVTVQFAVFPPSAVVTVIVAVPVETAVTSPLEETVATLVLLLDQVTAWFVAPLGAIVAESCLVFPTATVAAKVSRLTPVTATAWLTTVTVQLAVFPPSAVVTVMRAVPELTPVTVPSDATVATNALSVDQVALWFVALAGLIAGISRSVPPTWMVVLLLRLTPATGITTDTVQTAVFLPSSVVTVMRAVPTDTPLTVPSAATVATEALSVDQLTF
jgi:hypothetical protein